MASSKGGLPHSFFSGEGNLAWWSTIGAVRSDESASVRATIFDSASFMAGVSKRIGPDAGISFGLGYGHSTSHQFDAFGGGITTGDTLKTRLTGFVQRDNLIYDASMNFDYSWNNHQRVGYSDAYNMHMLGIGAGVNGDHMFAPDLTLGWRLGYAGTWTTRHASVDTFGVSTSRVTTEFHRLSASGKLTHDLAGQGGIVFADTKLNAVLFDDTIAAFAANRFDLEVGMGTELAFDNGATLDLRLYIGGIGRSERQSYGASVDFRIDF